MLIRIVGSLFLVVSMWAQAPPYRPPAQPVPVQPAPAVPPPPAAKPQTAAAAPAEAGFMLNLNNASLLQVIDTLAHKLRINYILDPRVKGSVTINTYGEIKEVDTRSLLETVLRINGAAMVQVGDIYRIVPVADAGRLPIPLESESKNIPDDERITLNLIFLKYATVSELAKLIEPFLGEGGKVVTYEPANLMLILDNARNMRRTMDLISVFDNDTLAAKRVRLFEVKYGRPSDLAKDLESVMKAVSFGGDKSSVPIRFLAIDRINTIVAIAPNPGVFEQVEAWLKRLDIEPKVTAGSVDNYVYRVKYGWASMLSGAIMQLYLGYSGGYGMGGMGYGMGGSMGYGGMLNGFGGGGYGGLGGGMMGGYGGGMGGGYGGGMMGGGYGGGMMGGGYGGGMMGGGYGGGMMGGYGGYGGGYGGGTYAPSATPMTPATATTGTTSGTTSGTDLTGSYLGSAGGYGMPPASKIPRVIPNPFDNTLLIQATPQDYQQILKLLQQLDVAPRQVLIEAKIYEVDLTGEFSSGVQAYLQRRSVGLPSTFNGSTQPQGSLSPSSTATNLVLTAGMLVGNSKELLGILNASESSTRAKLVSAPSLIATDSIEAEINVGDSVPAETGTITGAITSTAAIATSINNVQTGLTLDILARVTPSGIITLKINQQVSAPEPPPTNVSTPSGSPSFSNRAVSTQVTVQDGDTIAIGGIITESDTYTSAGIPYLNRIPGVGLLFGGKTVTKQRTELVIFYTPRVIYDTNQMVEAGDEVKSQFKKLRSMIQE